MEVEVIAGLLFRHVRRRGKRTRRCWMLPMFSERAIALLQIPALCSHMAFLIFQSLCSYKMLLHSACRINLLDFVMLITLNLRRQTVASASSGFLRMNGRGSEFCQHRFIIFWPRAAEPSSVNRP
jgi:hypothetical protein